MRRCSDEYNALPLQRNLRREGVFRSLEAAGASDGDDVEIRGRIFAYVPDASDTPQIG